MRIPAAVLATALAASAATVPVIANARDNDPHHGWNNHHRHQVCNWTWRHHHRVRVCHRR